MDRPKIDLKKLGRCTVAPMPTGRVAVKLPDGSTHLVACVADAAALCRSFAEASTGSSGSSVLVIDWCGGLRPPMGEAYIPEERRKR